MRRLQIEWRGTGNALAALRQELEQYGHVAGTGSVDLVIEDGSQPLPPSPARQALKAIIPSW